MKNRIYTIIYAYLIAFGSILTGYSMPADRRPIEVTQPDGSKLTILLKGDEFLHLVLSTDGYDLCPNKEGFYTYASRDSIGRLVPGEVVARNVSERSSVEWNFLNSQQKSKGFTGTVLSSALHRRMSRTPSGGASLRSVAEIPPGLLSDYPHTGSPKSLVILVNFSDVQFKDVNTTASFNDMLNQAGYNQNDHVGSVRDYYNFNSGGTFSPQFVVVGPVTLSNPEVYYGENDADGNDLRPAKMVYDACKLADNLVNFSNFDFDNDGYVDNVYIYYAGKGEADGGGANTIWPHSWSLVSSRDTLTLDGKNVDAYACSGELNGRTGQMTGMGTFTHEYSHILGLTDMYDVDYEKYNGEAFDLNYWSLMAYGAYNNNSSTPPCLTLPERYFLGWASPTVLDTAQQGVTLTDLGSTNKGYLIKTANSGEYYLLENRQQNKNVWDAYLPYHGMLIYHIDLRMDQQLAVNYWGTPLTLNINEMWRMNVVNALALHQCCDLEEADGQPLLYTGKNYTEYIASIKADPFPGTTGVTQFTDNTTPSMMTWGGSSLVKPITGITETNGVIRFNFIDFSSFKKAPVVLAAQSVGPFSFTARWKSVVNATGYYLDVFSIDHGKRKYLDGFQFRLVTDTVQFIQAPNDRTTYFYQVKGTNNNAYFTPESDSMSLTTTDATPTILPATAVDQFAFKANWQKASYATGYYLEVFTIDAVTGDTTWLDGYKNFYLTNNYLLLGDLDDQTTYQYRIRGTNGKAISQPSSVTTVVTTKATDLVAYAKDKTIVLKGMDKNAEVTVHTPDGLLVASVRSNHIAVPRSGVYLVTAPFDGKSKQLKLLIP